MNPRSFYLFSLLLWVSVTAPASAATDPKVLHAINRLSFGARPGDIQKVETIGVERYIQQQLQPEKIAASSQLSRELAQLPTLQMTPAELLKFRPQRSPNEKSPNEKLPNQSSPNAQKPGKQAKQMARTPLEEAVQARLLRATESDRQLQEVMVDFWYNHFNVFAGKGLDRFWVGAYEQTAIRPHAMGRFRDLLGATARHPAMLFYLDNWQNTAPNSPGARGRFQGLNENYARELMELHTLGVKGGYTQQDVVTLAKILTGWSIGRPGGTFAFDAKRHDSSDKVFLNQPIKGGGVEEGDRALDILAKHPATAQHISYKLAQYFVADEPPKSLVDRLAQKYLVTDGDIRAMLDTLFRSGEFWDSRYYNTKFKTPYQYVISALRASDTKLENYRPVYGALQQLGMPLYGCQTPDGYKNTQDAWLNPDAMTRRISFATAIATGRLPRQGNRVALKPNQKDAPLTTISKPIDAVQLTTTLGDRFSDQTRQTIAANPPQLRAALILGSPEFMRR
jgi:uncharacterized protein (DUF1800 family)